MTNRDELERDYKKVTEEWIEHESIREEVLDMVIWWVNRDDHLRKAVAHYAAKVYRNGEK